MTKILLSKALNLSCLLVNVSGVVVVLTGWQHPEGSPKESKRTKNGNTFIYLFACYDDECADLSVQ